MHSLQYLFSLHIYTCYFYISLLCNALLFYVWEPIGQILLDKLQLTVEEVYVFPISRAGWLLTHPG